MKINFNLTIYDKTERHIKTMKLGPSWDDDITTRAILVNIKNHAPGHTFELWKSDNKNAFVFLALLKKNNKNEILRESKHYSGHRILNNLTERFKTILTQERKENDLNALAQ